MSRALRNHPKQNINFIAGQSADGRLIKQQISYEKLDQESSRFANILKDFVGIEKGGRVAVMSPNLAEVLIAALGTWKAGAVLTPIKDSYKAPQLEKQINDTQAKVLVIFEDFESYAAEILTERELTSVSHIFVIRRKDLGLEAKNTTRIPQAYSFKNILRLASIVPLYPEAMPSDLAAINYTICLCNNCKVFITILRFATLHEID